MILLRHGQSHFNVHFGATRQDPGIVDPGLTEEGIRQIAGKAEDLKPHDTRRIIASPYSRTLHSAEIVAEALELPVSIEPLVGERAYFTCDIGTPRSELAELWPKFDFDHIEERWWPSLDETEEQVKHRCERFRQAMAAVEDWRHVLVVTHWGFIRGLTGQEVTNAEHLHFDPLAAATA